jgi:hypothetical protein
VKIVIQRPFIHPEKTVELSKNVVEIAEERKGSSAEQRKVDIRVSKSS